MFHIISLSLLIFCFFQTNVRAESSLQPSQLSGKAKVFNPDISANFLGLLQRGTKLSDDRRAAPYNGLSLQEAEIQFTSDVDPYLRAVALFSLAQEASASKVSFGIDPEEVFLETIFLPSVTLRAGKFKMALGKHNQLHSHAFPFLDSPLILQQLLGDEGLNEVGVSAAALLPLPWYSELVFQGFSLSNQDLYASPRSGDWGGLVHFKNLWDLSDDFTMELGASGTGAKNISDQTASVLGGDLTFKWRPAVGGKYQALIWSTEYLNGYRPGKVDSTTGESLERLGGVAAWIQYQFAERWWVQGRYEYIGAPHAAALMTENKQSALIGFFPSEFSGFRLQYDRHTVQNQERADHRVALQYNVSIGAHPAHAY